jgi:hypothetical protein
VAVGSLPWLMKVARLESAVADQESLLQRLPCPRVTFYFLLCYRPFGISSAETSLFNIYFASWIGGTLKPVRWGVSDGQLDKVKAFGVKTFEDFTWKHARLLFLRRLRTVLGQLPANAVGRPLSPRFITIKARDYAFQHYPMFGARAMASLSSAASSRTTKSGLAPRAALAKKNARCWWRSTRSSICDGAWLMTGMCRSLCRSR